MRSSDSSGSSSLDEEAGLPNEAPRSPESSNSHDSGSPDHGIIAEPFYSSLSYIEEQQQRLDDSSVSSGGSRFRCVPRQHQHGSDDEDDHESGSQIRRQVALAQRFMAETFDDEPEEEFDNSDDPKASNSDPIGFLRNNSSRSRLNKDENDMWQKHSDRHQRTVDQSVNLMDAESARYSNGPQHQPSKSTKKNHIDAIKKPFSFFLSRNTSDFPVLKESKPFIDIDLNNTDPRRGGNIYHPHTGTSPHKKSDQGGRFKALIMLGFILAIGATWIVSVVAPKHNEKLSALEGPKQGGVVAVGTPEVEEGADKTESPTDEKITSKNTSSKVEDEIEDPAKIDEGEDSNDKIPAPKVLQGANNTKTVAGVMSPSQQQEQQQEVDTKSAASSNIAKGKSAVQGNNQAKQKISAETAKGDHQGQQELDDLLLITSGVDPEGTRRDAIQYLVEQMGLTETAKFQDEFSSAYLALQWIATDDEAQLAVPGFDTTPSPNDSEILEQLLQRYALALLYFEMEADVNPNVEDAAFEMGTDDEKENRLELDLKWTRKSSVCDWPGVKCEHHRVVALNLTRSLLEGTLPTEILDGIALPRLTSLDLSYNKVHGSLPVIRSANRMLLMGKPSVHALKYLSLRHNRISGNLESLPRYENLESVDLSYNGLAGQIPDSLADLSRLEYLSLYGNSFKGEIPASLGFLENIKTLFLDDNKLEGTVPRELGDLQNLESLRLLENHLIGSVPDEICDLTIDGKLSFLVVDCSMTCDCCTRCWRE